MTRLIALFLLFQASLWSAAPEIAGGGVVNSADYGPAISSGCIFSIYGADLAPSTAGATETPLPTTLAGVSVLITLDQQTVPAPLFFVSAGQINAQMPYGAGGREVGIQVRTAEGSSNVVRVPVVSAAPRFYTKTLDGRGEAILLHADYSWVSEAAPAKPGEVVILYLAGLGEVQPAATAGVPAGDGGALGPLNAVDAPVTVTIGGQEAVVYWAGLAPGFAGLYQINLQMPEELPGGMAVIHVGSRGGSTQPSVVVATQMSGGPGAPPEEVLQSALKAQARGDVEAFLRYFALSSFSSDEIEESRRAFTLLRDRVGMSELAVTHVATGFGDLGNMAVVRAEVAYRLTSGGLSELQRDGVIATFVGENGAWRILSLDPDHLLNLEIDERQADGAALKAEGVPQSRAHTIHEINALLNSAMTTRNMDETEMAKLTADANFAFIGRFPGIGDAIAQVYQVANVGYDLFKAGEELVTRGFTPIFVLKSTQVAAGGLQIATELVPGADAAADAFSAYVEEVGNRHELKRAVREYQRELSHPKEGYRAYMFPLPASVYKYPDGMIVSDDPEVDTPYGRPPQGVAFRQADHIGRQIPFQVIADMKLSAQLERFADRLGAKKIDGEYRIPVDISMAADIDPFYNVVVGDPVLVKPRIIRSNSGSTTAISYTATCTRGFQQLGLRLHNRQSVLGPEVANKYMNEIGDVEARPLSNGKVSAPVNGTQSLKIFGKPSVEGAEEIDMTDSRECLEVSADSPEIFTFQRGPNILITGVAAGEAPLHLTLLGAGYKLEDQYPAVEKDVPVVVSDSLLPMLRQTNFVLGSVGGLHRCEDSKTGELGPISFGLSNSLRSSDGVTTDFPIAWEGGGFKVDGEVEDSNQHAYTLHIEGTIDPSGRNVATAQFELQWKVDLWEARKTLHERTIKFTVSNLPLDFVDSGFKNFYFTVEGSDAPAHVSGLTYLYRWVTASEEIRCSYAGSDYNLGPHATVSFDRR